MSKVIGIIAKRKKVAIKKNGTENPNNPLRTDPMIGPKRSPKLIKFKFFHCINIRCHCFHDTKLFLEFMGPEYWDIRKCNRGIYSSFVY